MSGTDPGATPPDATKRSPAQSQTTPPAPPAPWFFGLLRESGSYRIVAAGPTEARILRAMSSLTAPTLVATLDELAGLGIPDAELGRWLPDAVKG